jgi:hypothetical protein
VRPIGDHHRFQRRPASGSRPPSRFVILGFVDARRYRPHAQQVASPVSRFRRIDHGSKSLGVTFEHEQDIGTARIGSGR